MGRLPWRVRFHVPFPSVHLIVPEGLTFSIISTPSILSTPSHDLFSIDRSLFQGLYIYSRRLRITTCNSMCTRPTLRYFDSTVNDLTIVDLLRVSGNSDSLLFQDCSVLPIKNDWETPWVMCGVFSVRTHCPHLVDISF